MLICLACRRQDGDHALNCSYITEPDEDGMIHRLVDYNDDLFESERLTQRSTSITEADIAAIHPVIDAPWPRRSSRRVPVQTTDEFLLAILAEPTQLERYGHSMAIAEPNDEFDQRMKAVMAEMNRIDAQRLLTTLALMSWPEDKS